MIFSPHDWALATSATDLIIPIGLLIWLVATPLATFFVFLWRGGESARGITFSSILGLVLSIVSLSFGVAPEPILWIYDNQTTTFISVFLVPQAQAVDLYYLIWIWEAFLVMSASLKLVFEVHYNKQDEEES